MTTARLSHTATLLADGRVLIAGRAAMARSAEIYDPKTGTFSPTGSMTTARAAAHTATLLADGRVLVAGGHPRRSDAALASAELYDPDDRHLQPDRLDDDRSRCPHGHPARRRPRPHRRRRSERERRLGRDLRPGDRDLRADGAVGTEGSAVLTDQVNEARWRP